MIGSAMPILPAGKCLFDKTNVTTVEVAQFWDDGAVYVYKSDKKYKFVFSAGRLTANDSRLGGLYALAHDQTGKSMGTWELVGIVDLKDKQVTGWIGEAGPAKGAPLAVFK